MVLEFANDNIKSDICNISDEGILKIDENGITYEAYDIKHFIDFKQCCKNRDSLHDKTNMKCVGERDIMDTSFIFYTYRVKIKLTFLSF